MKLGEYAYAENLRRLLIMAVLPVVDGFFLSFLVTGMWHDPWQAVAFGATAFSGGACIIAAMKLEGSLWARLAQTLGVYAILALFALVATIFLPVLTQILPQNLGLFTSIFLLGLGLYTTGLPWLQGLARWMGFEASIKVMLVATLISAFTLPDVDWALHLDPAMARAVVIALVAGFMLTVSGVILGRTVAAIEDRRPLDWGAGLSLMLMGLRLLHVSLPSALILAPLALGYVWLAVPLVVRRARSLLAASSRATTTSLEPSIDG